MARCNSADGGVPIPMPRINAYAAARAAVLLTSVGLLVNPGTAAAQGCVENTTQATGPSRDAALREAYETVLKATDQALWKAWMSTGQRIGEAPGYTVRKLTSKCSAGGAGQICRIEVTLCKN